jgi:hypothetical protein
MKAKNILTEDRFSGKSIFDSMGENTLKYTLVFSVVLAFVMIILEVAGL